MTILSVNFLLFIIVLIILYYCLPKRLQWPLLLLFSLVFYCSAGFENIIFILITATTTYLSAKIIQRHSEKQKEYLKENRISLSKEEKERIKVKGKRLRKRVLVAALVVNFGILCSFKYVHFVIEQVNRVAHLFGGTGVNDVINWIVPLGISFYTFQSMGYLLDVYWNKCTAENNYFKVLLFTSFFPQITQGPISSFHDLTTEIFKEHSFNEHNYAWGAQRMIWGLFKKAVIADTAAIYVQDIFSNYTFYTGIATLIGAFLYSLQIYADFSGYMDMMCGLCEILDIKLTENFERPYFSKSIAEYWRRWHISLGAWFKNYVYYPLAMAKWNQKLGRKARQKFGKTFGQYLPASIALVVVWLTTGMWHGASWAYIAWGGVNGLFIIFSMWMEHTYANWKAKLHINEFSLGWRVFRVIRTFILVTFIKVLPEVGTLSQGWGLWVHIFAEGTIPHSRSSLLPNMSTTHAGVLFAGTAILFAASMIQRKQPVRQWFGKFPAVVKCFILACMVVISLYYASGTNVGGFMYAQF